MDQPSAAPRGPSPTAMAADPALPGGHPGARGAGGRWRAFDLAGELRYAVRSLARAKTFSMAAIACVALGVGANTAIFSVVSTVLLRPIQTPWVDELVVIHDDAPGIGLRNTEVAPAEALDIAARRDLFQASTAFTSRTYNLPGYGEPRRITATATLGEFFQVFGVRPYLGRFYRPDDSRNGEERQVVLSYGFWQSLTGGARDVVGRTLLLDGNPYQVVGVLPPEFSYPRTAQIFIPFAYDPKYDRVQERGTLIMTAVSRLQAGVSLEEAQTGLREEARRWHRRYEPEFRYEAIGHTLVAVPFAAWLAGSLRNVALVLMGAVGLVLLIACANVASLQLVRGTVRAKELAVRSALGATPGQLARPLLAESTVIAVAGGLLGLGVGAAIMRLLTLFTPPQYSALRDLHLDLRVLGAAALAAVLSGILFGTAPALYASRTHPLSALKEDARGASGGRGRSRLLQRIVSAQVALTTVLLLGSGLLLRSLGRVLEADPGFRMERVITASVSLPESTYGSGGEVTAFFDRLVERMGAVPGIRAVGLTNAVPLSGEGDSSPIRRTDRPMPADASPGHANMNTVSEGYFRAMGIRLVKGRLFDRTDDDFSPRVVVVDEQFAKQYFPGEDPIGKSIDQGRPATIIGVVGSANHKSIGEPPKATTYYSYRQNYWVRTMSLVVETRIDPAQMTRTVRQAIAEMDPRLAVFDVRLMAQRVEDSLRPRRFAALVLSGFAVLALVLSVLGIYGVLSYTTAQRGRELGIRMALGARSGEVARMVLARGAWIAGLGVGIGVLAFLALGRTLEALVYGVRTADPLTVVLGAALLTAVALAASYLPARWASRIDPAQALRAE